MPCPGLLIDQCLVMVSLKEEENGERGHVHLFVRNEIEKRVLAKMEQRLFYNG